MHANHAIRFHKPVVSDDSLEMIEGNNTNYVYCAFCRTGSEEAVARAISQNDPELVALAPRRILTEKRQGKWEERTVSLLPGYVFLYVDRDMPIKLKAHAQNLYKILEYERGIARLSGQDEEYGLWVYRNQGQIKPSKVLIDGDNILAVDGLLKDFKGKIVKVDKHKKRVWVEFEFDHMKQTVSLSIEWVERENNQD